MTSKTSLQPPCLGDLPPDITTEICGFLGPKTLQLLGNTCRYFRNFLKDEELNVFFLKNHFNSIPRDYELPSELYLSHRIMASPSWGPCYHLEFENLRNVKLLQDGIDKKSPVFGFGNHSEHIAIYNPNNQQFSDFQFGEGFVLRELFPDNKTAVIQKPDGGLSIFNLDENTYSLHLQLHRCGISASKISPDGSILITAEPRESNLEDPEDGVIKLRGFDLATGNRLWKSKITESTIDHIDVRGGRVLTVDDCGKINVWSVATGERICDLYADAFDDRSHNGTTVTYCKLSEDGLKALIADDQGQLMLWDLDSTETAMPHFILKGHDAEITCVAWSADEKRAISGDSNGHLFVWDLEQTQFHKAELPRSPTKITCLKISSDGKRAIAGNGSGDLNLWDLSNKTHIQTLHKSESAICCLYADPLFTEVVCGDDNGDLISLNLCASPQQRVTNILHLVIDKQYGAAQNEFDKLPLSLKAALGIKTNLALIPEEEVIRILSQYIKVHFFPEIIGLFKKSIESSKICNQPLVSKFSTVAQRRVEDLPYPIQDEIYDQLTHIHYTDSRQFIQDSEEPSYGECAFKDINGHTSTPEEKIEAMENTLLKIHDRPDQGLQSQNKRQRPYEA